MKKSDIAMIIFIASVSAMIAFAVASSLPALKPAKEGVKVKIITAYEESVVDPDTSVFYGGAINPTVKTVIGSDAAQPAQ